MKTIKQDISGFSLVEVIVVVLIIGILATGAAISLSVIYNADSERAARTLVNILTTARTKAMSQNDDSRSISVVARIRQDSKGDYYAGVYKMVAGIEDEVLVPEEKVSNSRVEINLVKNNGTSTPIDFDGLNQFEFSFKKSTGGLSKASLDAGYCKIDVKGTEEFRIVFSSASGRCRIE